MTPQDLLALLLNPHAPPADWKALEALLRKAATRAQVPQQERDDLVQIALFKLIQNARTGELVFEEETAESVGRYLFTMVRNGNYDRGRKAQRVELTDQNNLVEIPTSARSAEEILATEDAHHAANDLLDRVVTRCLEQTALPYRAGRQTAWKQVRELFEERSTLRDVVIRDEELGAETSEKALGAALNRAMKNHERIRTAVIDTADRLRAANELTVDEAAMVVRMVLALKRRSES